MIRTYQVPDIHCGHCKQKIETGLSGTEGIERVEVDTASQTVTVEGTVSDESVKVALADVGYPVGA